MQGLWSNLALKLHSKWVRKLPSKTTSTAGTVTRLDIIDFDLLPLAPAVGVIESVLSFRLFVCLRVTNLTAEPFDLSP